MKRISLLVLIIFLLLNGNFAFAAKARSIASDADSQYHTNHLQNHLGETICFATGNYIKTRDKANGSKVIGHLEQADEFILLNVKNGWAQIEVKASAKNSPDSWNGMIGWVDSDYIDCICNNSSYYASSIYTPVLSSPFPQGMPDGWMHSSGAGAWSTQLRIRQDGSFYGYFHDADMGDCGNGYPNGTLYECLFYGQFSDIHSIDSNIYSMTVSEFSVVGTIDSQYIYEDVLHVITNPGIHAGDVFRIYTPGSSKQRISDEHLSWLHGIVTDPLSSFALCNMSNSTAFDPGSDYPNSAYFISSSKYYCKANNLRIRNKPNGTIILGHLNPEDSFVVNGIVDGWANIIVMNPSNNTSESFPGLAGWVSMDYLRK